MNFLTAAACVGLTLPTVLWADPPSFADLTPTIPGNQSFSAETLANIATPVIPRLETLRQQHEDNAAFVTFDPLAVTPTCIVIANATIGQNSAVQQNTNVNTLNVNCE